MLDAIEKMRKLLTANKETDINLDSLMEDEDFNKHFTREELEKLMEPFMVDFSMCLKEALSKSGLTT